MAGERIVSAMQAMASNGIPPTERTDLVYGTVTSIAPLVISVQAENKQMPLTEGFLVLSAMCLQKTVVVTRPAIQATCSSAGDPSHTHVVTVPAQTVTAVVWRGLLPGDNVKMLRIANGAQYYVLERVGDYNVTV